MRTAKSLLATLLLVPCTTLMAQQRVEPGRRVRLTAPTVNLDRFVATVVSADADTLVVLSQDFSHHVPFTSITKLEVAGQRGDASRMLRGGVIGLGAGTAAGVISVLLMQEDEPRWQFAVPYALGGTLIGTSIGYGGNAATRGMGLGFLIGAGAGALVGAVADLEGTDWARRDFVLLTAGFGAALGLVVGPIVGIVTSGWQEVPLDRARVGFVPQRHGGLGLGVSVEF